MTEKPKPTEAAPASDSNRRRMAIYAILALLVIVATMFVWVTWDARNRIHRSIQVGNQLLSRYNFIDAEQQFQQVLRQDPSNLQANDRLAYILGLGSRSWELIPRQLAVLKQGQATPQRLYVLAMSDRMPTDASVILAARRINPEDPVVLMGWADLAVREGRYPEAEVALRTVVSRQSDWLESHVRLGQLLLAKTESRVSELIQWQSNLRPHSETHPGIWIVYAGIMQKMGRPDSSVRCFWEALRRDPNHQQAHYQIGQLLRSLRRPEPATAFLKRAQKLQQYETTVYGLIARFNHTGVAVEEYQPAARQAEELGLLWEALSWYRLAEQLDGKPEWAKKGAVRLAQRARSMPLERAAADVRLADQIDLSDLPLPDWSIKSLSPSTPSSSLLGQVRFEDRAAVAHLNFRYQNGGQPLKGLKRVYEFTGGGTAVLDVDQDGWPDIHLTQGGKSPVGANTLFDQLFRNRGDGTFQNVTEFSRLSEDRYSQGVAAGDFNADGFPDLYIGNFGPNRLYQNNGDGTFSDVTEATGTAGDAWTTSCLLADINGDSWPDIYAVNYLTGPDVLDRICRDETGPVESCLPQNFPAAQDQLYLNLGDGRFENVTATAGIAVSDGKGLGIVAADFDGSRRLSLFIANDSVPNFFFVNQSTGRGTRPKFVDQALETGLAYDADGKAQACMGVAADDADGDGWLDLFVTNFTEESNTLYRQHEGRLFVDETRSSGLREPSLALLGFGTQFIDGELDGRPDLIVTNGHVDDYRPRFGYQMRPQYFSNVGQGRFVESSADQLGPYFQGKYLGRGLARLDWNRDGREDVVISHLDAPVALLTNTTPQAGHFVAVQLIGTRGNRDAIGTIVVAHVGHSKLTRQLTAGDGYQASNQRQLVFGLGDRTTIDLLEIHWSSGVTQRFEHVKADEELLIIEGRSAPVRLND